MNAPANLSVFDNDQPDNDEWEIDLSNLAEADFSVGLRPLHRFRDRMLALDGLSLLSARADPHGDAHAKGYCSALTGHPARSEDGVKSHAATLSVDQLMARELRALDSSLTDLTSVEYGITRKYATNFGRFHQFIYGEDNSGAAVKIPAEPDFRAAFDRLFPNAGVDISSDPFLASQASVLDTAGAQYEAMYSRLGTEDRQKLESHRDLIRDLENRIRASTSASCNVPPRLERDPANDGPAMNGRDWHNGDEVGQYRDNIANFIDLTAAAFSCGLTRVATLQFHGPPVSEIGGSGDLHHDYAHKSDHDVFYDPMDLPDMGTAARTEMDLANEVMTNHMAHYAGIVAQLADRLDQIPEGNGTVLDNTTIVWMNELSSGGHGHDQYPAVLVGGHGGYFRNGRYIRYARNNPEPANRNWGRQYLGQPHNQLLVSLCRSMGLDHIDQVGLDEVTGTVQRGPNNGDSKTISLRGELPRLR